MSFVKLAEVETLEEVPEGATVFAEVDGTVKRIPGSGLGGTNGADWNAAEGEDGYIANKPFDVGLKKIKLADVLTIEFTATATDDGSGNTVYVADIAQYFSTLGRITTYFGDQSGPYGGMPMFYSLDGVEYELTVSDYNDMGVSFSRAFGNASLRKPDGTDTGEPMYLSVWSPSDYNHQVNIYVADDKPHSISFYVVEESVHKLDAKFVPSNVIYTTDCPAPIDLYNAANKIIKAGQTPTVVQEGNVYVLTLYEYDWSVKFTNFDHSGTNVYVHSVTVDANGNLDENHTILTGQGE